MNRDRYYSAIEESLNLLSLRVARNSSLNLQNLNIHSENFYAQLFNLFYGYDFINLNNDRQNFESIDLVDSENKIFAQVSATSTKKKIESTLDNKKLEEYKDYRFIFIFISNKDAKRQRQQTYKNPYNISFNPQDDIYDVKRILSDVQTFDIDRLKAFYDFIKKELIPEIDKTRIDSDLVKIINILSKENLDEELYKAQVLPFEIEKKINFNNLSEVKENIQDYAVYSNKLNKKYTEFDKLGINKSRAILNSLRALYIKGQNTYSNPVELFYKIIDITVNKIQKELPDNSISLEELNLYVQIIVVDAFMKCKIFKNPEEN